MGNGKLEGLFIREACMADVDYLVELNAALAWETESRILDHHRLRAGTKAVLERPSRGRYLVGEIRGTGREDLVVGQLLITYEWSDWRNASFWWLQSVFVRSEWRKRGIFRAMFEVILEQARREPDVCGVRLYVEHHNDAAIKVYENMGLAAASYRMLEWDFVLDPNSEPSSH